VRLLHSLAKAHASFDDPNLVSHAGLVPVMALAERAGLADLVAEHVRPAGECGVNAHLKVPCLVAGMAAGADSIDGMDLLRHGAMDALFGGVRAPSTLGSHLRSYTWGNVAQVEKAGREFLAELARQAPLLPGAGTLAFIDIDSMQKRVYGHRKQGARFGHTKIQGKSLLVRGLNALAAVVSTPLCAPVIAATRPDGLGLLHRRGDRRGPRPGCPVLRHRPHEREHPRRDRRHRRRRLDRHQVPASGLGRPAGCLDLRCRGRRD